MGLFKQLLQKWNDWTGDRYLDLAIKRELRRLGLAVNASQTRNVRLIAVQRPGWVQVRSFSVETLDKERHAVEVLGLARDDGRREQIDVLLTRDRSEFNACRDAWSDGLIRRGEW